MTDSTSTGLSNHWQFIHRAAPAIEPTLRLSPSAAPSGETRILIADDSGVNQRVCLGQLRMLGYTADVVSNGLEALNALHKVSYDLILMDCQMPEMDGYEATRAIRKSEAESRPDSSPRGHIHIVAVTANAMKGDREKCLESGMDDYVSKPVRIEDLQAAIERFQVLRAASIGRSSVLPSDQAAPVDMERLREMAGDEPDGLPELVDLYLTQVDQLMNELRTAIRAERSREVARLAHKLGGSSSSCGMNAVAAPLLKLERLAPIASLSENEPLFFEVRQQVDLTRRFLATRVSDARTLMVA